MKKRFLGSILTMLLALVTVCAFGCGGGGGGKKESESSSDYSESVGGENSSESSGGENEYDPNVTFYMMETLSVQEYAQAEIDYVLSGALESDVVWKSSDESIASVENGLVAGVSEGTVVITATVKGHSATCVVTVTQNYSYPTLVLSQKDVMPRVDGEVAVAVSVRFNGENVAYSNFEWVSADTSIATVENGVIKGVAVGETTVTVKATYGGVRLEEEIAVKVVKGPAA